MHSRQLEYFKHVSDAGNLSQAALSLGITQPALSKHIRDLETELHVRLFHRTGRGVMLTPDGERLLEHTVAILDRMAAAKEQALQSRNAPVDSITIGVTPTIGRRAIVPITRSLTADSPGIALHFVEGFSAHLLEWLTAGRIDLALLYDSGAASRLHAEPLLREQLHLIAAADAPRLPASVPFRQLADEQLVLPGTPYGLRPLIEDAAQRAGVVLAASVEADGFGSLIDLVIGGVGKTILPAAVVQREIESGKLQAAAIRDPEVERKMVLVTATNRVHARGLSTVVKIVKAEIRALSDPDLPPTRQALALAG